MVGKMPLATLHGIQLQRQLHSDYDYALAKAQQNDHQQQQLQQYNERHLEVAHFAPSAFLNVARMSMDFIAGCLGGCAGVIVGHPLDTIKVHLQTQDPRNPKYNSILHCMRSIVREDGMRGLYRGITSPMAGIGLVNAIVFGIYGNVQRATSEPNSLYSHFLAGSTAGLLQSVVCAPMELAKTRLQLQHGSQSGVKHKGPLDCIRHIYRTEGLRGSFKGLGITAIRDVPGFASYFVSYEYMMSQTHTPTAFHTLMAGGFAGIFSWLACYPTDVIKTCLQADGMSARPQYSGIIDCARKGYQSDGYHFFVRGLASTLIRAFPMNAACFFVVSLIMQMTDGKKIDVVVQSGNDTLNLLNMANATNLHQQNHQQHPHQHHEQHQQHHQQQQQQQLELEQKLGLVLRHKSSGSLTYPKADGGFTVDAGGGGALDAAAEYHNNDAEFTQIARHRFYMRSGLKAFDVFNDAICLSEVNELANDLYPDRDYNNNNSNNFNNNTNNNNNNIEPDNDCCYYYVYEDVRIAEKTFTL